VVDRMRSGDRRYFSLNIDHPTALTAGDAPDVRPEGSFSMRGYSIGGYGSVTTNKIIATVASELFGLHVQAYPKYGSEKKGLPTNYYLTLSPGPIRTHCEMAQAEFVPLNNVNALDMGNPFMNLSPGAIAFLQWERDDPAALWERFPLPARHALRLAGARVYYMDAARIAREESIRPDLEIRMQGIVLLGVFLRVSPFGRKAGMDDAALLKGAEEALRHYFGKLSDEVVAANLRCVTRGFNEVREVPAELMRDSMVKENARYKDHTVAEVMHRGVITCGLNDPLPSVVNTMAREGISAIVVLNENKEMAGILSTTDLSRATLSAAGRGELPELLPRHIMTPDVITTWPGEPLWEALEKMLDHHVHRLVVVEKPGRDSHPIGILGMRDISLLQNNHVQPER